VTQFIPKITTGAGTRVYRYNPVTKPQSSGCKSWSYPHPMKAIQVHSNAQSTFLTSSMNKELCIMNLSHNKGSNEPSGSIKSRGYLDYLRTSFSRTPPPWSKLVYLE